MRKLYSVLLSFMFITSSFAQIPTNGLVSEWLFDNSTITNGSNSLLAILGGSPTAAFANDRFGNPNSAVNVNPGGFINFAGDEFDTYTTGANATFAYSFWIKLDAFDNAYRCIMAKASFESLCQIPGRQYAILVTPAGKLQLQAFGSLTGGHARVDGNTTLTVGDWHHIVISVDMATLLASLPATTGLTMYVDGVLQTNTVSEISGSGILPSGMQDGPAHFGFGTYLNTAGAICAGTQNIDAHFDDFRIYNRTLDASDVANLMNDGCDEAVIIAQPQNTSVCTGTATLEITAESGTVSEIRWEWFNGTDWQDMGVSSPGPWDDIVLGNVYEGLFRAKLTSPCGAVSYSDVITYTWGGPAFTDSPSGNTQQVYLCPQIGSVELQSNALGENITYQWQQRTGPNVWEDINGATDPTYTTTSPGEYNVNVTACGVTETYVPYNVIQG
ncbi:MAG: LamG domain-containing protein, partial [Flavobacteriales bacterium]|nr:LamG domain-containing protein [Flavobacteriales bacterium]